MQRYLLCCSHNPCRPKGSIFLNSQIQQRRRFCSIPLFLDLTQGTQNIYFHGTSFIYKNTYVIQTARRLRNSLAGTLPATKRSCLPMSIQYCTNLSPFLNSEIIVLANIHSYGTRETFHTDIIKLCSNSCFDFVLR